MINKQTSAKSLTGANIPYLCGKAAPEHEPQRHIQHPLVWRFYMLNITSLY